MMFLGFPDSSLAGIRSFKASIFPSIGGDASLENKSEPEKSKGGWCIF